MTDKELCVFGESLYRAVRETPLPVGSIHALATAVQNDVPWSRLPGQLKVVVFKIAASTVRDATAVADEERRDERDADDAAADNEDAVLIPPPVRVSPPAGPEARPSARAPGTRPTEERPAPTDEGVDADDGPATAA